MKEIKILGFRSNKLWKKVISVAYLVQWGLVTIVTMLGEKVGKITTVDSLVDKIQAVVVLLVLIVPHVFLSETIIRKKMPLFKERKRGKSILGVVLVGVCLMILSFSMESMHTKEYKADMDNHDYRITKEVEATCQVEGEIHYLCDYCGMTKIETKQAKMHDWMDLSQEDATCTEDGLAIKKCALCDMEEKNVIPALGHEMKIASKIEPTCEADGLSVEICSRCNQKEEHILEARGHDMAQVSKTEATCDADGIIIIECTVCEYVEEEVIVSVGHDMKEVSRKEATEKEDGNIVQKCNRCGHEEVEILAHWGKNEQEYKVGCLFYSYEDVARDPDYYIGCMAAFRGEVIQVVESGDSVMIRMDVTYTGYYWQDTVYVEYTRKEGESRILEGDIIVVYGEMNGLKTYVTVLGSQVSIPYLLAEYVELN